MRKWKLHKWHKRWIRILIIFTVVVIFIPFLAGIWFQQNYQKLITHLNAENNVSIQILRYQRKYLHSYATLRVQITDPYAKIMLSSLNLDPGLLDFKIDQTITHGPFVFPRNHTPRWGLATMHNITRLYSTGAQVMEDDDVVGLRGSYFKYFQTGAIDFNLPPNYHVQFSKGIKGNVKIYSGYKSVSGSIDFIDFKIDDGDIYLEAPNSSLHFNQYKSNSGLWIGSVSLLVSEINGTDSEGAKFLINGIDFDGDSYETGPKLNNMLRLDVDRLLFGEQPIGPLHAILNISGLNIGAIKDMTNAYQKIMVEGEKYESQLSYKISMLFPLVFANGASIELSTFSLDTPIGPLLMQGIINWPVTQSTPPSDVSDLISSSDAQATVRVSKSLTDKLLDIASELPFFRDVSPETRRNLMKMQSDVEARNQQNFLMLSYLANNGFISEDAGIRLLNLQKSDVSLDVYSNEIKDLLMKKQIYLAASYLLRLKYSEVITSEESLDSAIEVVQNSFSQNLRNQLVDWLKKGYIQVNNDDYVINLDKQNEKIELNDKIYE